MRQVDIHRFERQIESATSRYQEGAKARRDRQKALAAVGEPGQWRNVDDPSRILRRLNASGLNRQAEYLLEHDQPPPPPTGAPAPRPESSFLERIIGTEDFLGAAFLPLGAAIRRSVGRIVDRASGFGFGTGFLVSHSLLMTNNHVLPIRSDAEASVVQFDYLTWPDSTTRPTPFFGLDPARFFVTDSDLDYTVVAVEPISAQGNELVARGWNRLIAQSGKAIFSDRVNIVQHPGGNPQQLSLRENRIVGKVDDFLHYEADTQKGSSGSPVYNDRWELGALHHSGVARRDNQGRILLVNGTVWDKDSATAHLIDWIANEGVRISSIVADLQRRSATFTDDQKRLLEETFEQLRFGTVVEGAPTETEAAASLRASVDAEGTAHWTVPLQISVGLGSFRRGSSVSSNAELDRARIGAATTSRESEEVTHALERLQDFVGVSYYDEAADQQAFDAYYADVPDQVTPEEWYRLFRDLVRRTHTTELGYKTARLEWLYPWIDLREKDGGTRELTGIYSGKVFDPRDVLTNEVLAEVRRSEALAERLHTEAPGEEALETLLEALEAQFPFNCEHVVPQSWFRKAQPMKADLHHLFTCEWGCNSFRGNQPYFDFEETEEALREQCGRREQGQGFEPVRGKGAAARATLYFLLRYPGLVGDEVRELQQERLDVLLDWHEQDPPGIYEFHRNAEIQKVQGNRNPLIDFAPMVRNIDFSLGFGP